MIHKNKSLVVALVIKDNKNINKGNIMISAKRLLAENLRNGKYKIVKERRYLPDTVICYLNVEDGEYLFTSHSGHQQILPVPKFKHGISISVEDGNYTLVAKTALSLWPVREESEQLAIIKMVEDLVINNVIQVDS